VGTIPIISICRKLNVSSATAAGQRKTGYDRKDVRCTSAQDCEDVVVLLGLARFRMVALMSQTGSWENRDN